MNAQIADAVKNRRLLSFTYQGHQRKVQPVDYGVSGKGVELLQTYQVGGTSKRGDVPSWRCFKVAEITDLVVLDETYTGAPPGYMGSSMFPTTYAVIDGTATPAGATPRSGGEATAPSREDVQKLAKEAGEIAGQAVKALGKWFRKR